MALCLTTGFTCVWPWQCPSLAEMQISSQTRFNSSWPSLTPNDPFRSDRVDLVTRVVYGVNCVHP
jgi:hypothetical protein